ncbi:MAG: PDC sensor domain-containing protein, partial [Planctomycetota bacterium]
FFNMNTIAVATDFSAAAVESEAKLPLAERTQLKQVLKEWKSLVDEARIRQGLKPDASWFIDDADGTQIYRAPNETVGKNYRHRDYFHGRRIIYPEGNVPHDVGPIVEPYVSMAYPSDSAGVYRVAITVPIFSSNRDKVIGVLGRSMGLEQLLAAYKPQIEAEGSSSQIERTIALFDGHLANDAKGAPTFQLLDHRWLSDRKLAKLDAETRKQLQIDPEHAHRLAQLQNRVENNPKPGSAIDIDDLDRSLNYQDPVGRLDTARYGGTWLAAFWPVGQTDWVAVVQERRSTAKHPVQEMEMRLTQYMHLGLLFCCALIGALWYFIFRVLSDQSRVR